MSGVEERFDHVDALVHLAAIPAPGLVPDHHTFIHNMTCTWNIVSAARRVGVTNIVWASSETVLGLPFDVPPPYIPVDENYPPRPESSYSLVKTLEEAMAVQLCRWNPALKMIGLRFSNVMETVDYARFPSFEDDPASGKWNMWGYIDTHDGAQAVRLALEFEMTGTEIFIIANADTVMSRPNRPSLRSSTPAWKFGATSGSTTPCCPSTRPGDCSATNRPTAGVTSRRPEPSAPASTWRAYGSNPDATSSTSARPSPSRTLAPG